jgi:hypothetical protein
MSMQSGYIKKSPFPGQFPIQTTHAQNILPFYIAPNHLIMKPEGAWLVELSNSRTEVVAALQRLKRTSVIFAPYITDGVAPPFEFGTF